MRVLFRPLRFILPLLISCAINVAARDAIAAPPPPEASVKTATSQPQPKIVYPWVPDQKDGTYRNPVLCADYSDPDVIRDGDDFYLVASSFTSTPGLPILHSRDLVNWAIVNHAVTNLPDPRGVFDAVQPGCGVWAPAMRKHDGKFWIFFPMPDEGIYVTTADDPRSRWSEPRLLIEGKGLIDPCPLWDDDGRAYLVHAYARSRAGIKNILRVRPMAPDASKLLGEGEIVYNDPEHQPTLEGPKFHKLNGYYYISAPAGGVGTGWQLILRSRSVYGPYEAKLVLEQGRTAINGPHQGALVDLPSGEWWFVHFQDASVYGRITHLQPVQWKDGWPLIGEDIDGNGAGEPVLAHAKPKVATPSAIAVPQTSDEFNSGPLGLQWQWQANHRDDWSSLSARAEWLRLRAASAEPDLMKVPHVLTQKLPAREFSVETRVELPAGSKAQAGLVIEGKKHAALVVRREDNGTLVTSLLVNNEQAAREPMQGDLTRLRLDMRDGGECRFSFASQDGSFHPIGPSVTATEGVWVGAKVGIFCRAMDDTDQQRNDYADFDYFRFGPPSSN